MDDGHDFGVGAIDLAVNEAFEIDAAPVGVDGLPVQIEFDNVVGGHVARRHVAGQQEAVRACIVTDADMAKCVDHAVVEKDVVGKNEIVE